MLASRFAWNGLSTRIVAAGGAAAGGPPPPANNGVDKRAPEVDVLLDCMGFLKCVCIAVPIDCGSAAEGGGEGGGSYGSCVGGGCAA